MLHREDAADLRGRKVNHIDQRFDPEFLVVLDRHVEALERG